MILFFYGPNSYAARMKIREMVERFKAKTGSNFDLSTIDGETETEPRNLINAILSPPMLSPNRLVIIEDLLKNKPIAESVIKVLDQVPKANVVIIYERKADERSGLFKELKKLATSHKFEELKPFDLQKWVRQSAQNLGGDIDNATTNYLIQRVGTDQWRLFNELTKLINYKPKISSESIDQLSQPHFEQTIFDLVENLSRGNSAQALQIYQGLRAQKAEPVMIAGMLGWALRNLLVAKVADGRPPAQIAEEQAISPFVLRRAMAIVPKIDIEVLKTAHSELAEADYRLKTINLEADILMEELIVSISQHLKVTS